MLRACVRACVACVLVLRACLCCVRACLRECLCCFRGNNSLIILHIFVIAAVIGISCVLLVVSEVIQFMTLGGDNSFHWGCPADDSQ